MLINLHQPISVTAFYNHTSRHFAPHIIYWQGRSYLVSQLGLHHQFRQGSTLIHAFSVMANGHFFLLHFNTRTLNWHLHSISDGLAA